MADPTKYTVSYDFTNLPAANDAPRLNNELANIQTSISQVVEAIKDIRRSDGKLNNGIVHKESLAPGVSAGVDALPALEKNTEFYESEAAFLAATVPSNTKFVYTSGYYTADDGGGHKKVKLSAPPSSPKSWQKQSVDGAWWEIAEDEPNLLMFGGKDDGVFSNTTALASVKTYIGSSGKTLRLPLVTSGIYNFPEADGFITLTGFPVRADKGVKVRGTVNYPADTLVVGNDLGIDYQSTALNNQYKFSTETGRLVEHKENFLREGDLDRKLRTGLDFTGRVAEKVTLASGDAWTASGGFVSADSWSLALTGDDTLNVQFEQMRGGEETAAVFAAGAYSRAAVVRYTGGYWCFMVDSAGNASLRIKNAGVAAQVFTGLGWFGKNDNPAWAADKAEWKIRVFNSRSIAFLLNGMEVINNVYLPGVVIDAGFGLYGTGVTGAVSYWSKTRRKAAFGPSPVGLLIVGDSTSAPVAGHWVERAREYLEGTFGVRVWDVYNQAVPGETSAQQAARLSASAALATATALVIDTGTNDSQASGPGPVTITNIEAMINTWTSAGKQSDRVVIVAPSLWYTKAMSGAGATAGANDANAAQRAALKKLAAKYRCGFVDLQEVFTAIRPVDLNRAAPIDPLVRDNVHHTVWASKLKANAIAEEIAMTLSPRMTPKENRTPLHPQFFLNSWTSHPTQPASYSVSEDRIVVLSGLMNAGTIANPTQIMRLPSNMRPAATKEFAARHSNGSVGAIYVSTDGYVTLNGFAAPASYASLDNVIFSLD